MSNFKYIEIDSEEATYWFTETDENIYFENGNNWGIVTLQGYIDALTRGGMVIYRKVEAAATLKDQIMEYKSANTMPDELLAFAKIIEEGDEATRFCHFVAELTDKPE